MKIERGIKALEFIKEECANGRKIKGQQLTKDFKVRQNFLSCAVKLGYIEHKGKWIYKWKVGEVMPIMAKKCMEEANKYFSEKQKQYRSKSLLSTDQATDQVADQVNDQVGEIKSVKFLDMQDYLGFDKLKHENESLKRLIDSLSEKLKDNKVLLKSAQSLNANLQDELDLESDAGRKWYNTPCTGDAAARCIHATGLAHRRFRFQGFALHSTFPNLRVACLRSVPRENRRTWRHRPNL
jgi:hypothetical protein